MYKVSVGIPVYYEERNLTNLLSSIMEQKFHEKIEIHEIIIVCDECSKKTKQVIQRFSQREPRIRVYYHNVRRGKAAVLNEIFDKATGNFIVLFDADVIPCDNYVISNLVSPLLSDPNIGLVGGLPVPLPPSNLIERAPIFSDKIQRYLKEHINNGQNIFAAHGRILGLNSKFAKNVKIPDIPGTDAFLYLVCIKSEFKFHYVGTRASVYFKAPNNVNDYLLQSIRFKKVQTLMRRLFGSTAHEAFKVYKIFLYLILAYVKNFFNDPLGAFLWIILFLYATIKSKKTYSSSKWEISRSSKQIKGLISN